MIDRRGRDSSDLQFVPRSRALLDKQGQGEGLEIETEMETLKGEGREKSFLISSF